MILRGPTIDARRANNGVMSEEVEMTSSCDVPGPGLSRSQLG